VHYYLKLRLIWCYLYSYSPFYYFCYSEYKYWGGGILGWVVGLLVGDIAFYNDSDNK
jgi:hypothetical protein